MRSQWEETETDRSWTDDLPLCPETGAGFATNSIYRWNPGFSHPIKFNWKWFQGGRCPPRGNVQVQGQIILLPHRWKHRHIRHILGIQWEIKMRPIRVLVKSIFLRRWIEGGGFCVATNVCGNTAGPTERQTHWQGNRGGPKVWHGAVRVLRVFIQIYIYRQAAITVEKGYLDTIDGHLTRKFMLQNEIPEGLSQYEVELEYDRTDQNT